MRSVSEGDGGIAPLRSKSESLADLNLNVITALCNHVNYVTVEHWQHSGSNHVSSYPSIKYDPVVSVVGLIGIESFQFQPQAYGLYVYSPSCQCYFQWQKGEASSMCYYSSPKPPHSQWIMYAMRSLVDIFLQQTLAPTPKKNPEKGKIIHIARNITLQPLLIRPNFML